MRTMPLVGLVTGLGLGLLAGVPATAQAVPSGEGQPGPTPSVSPASAGQTPVPPARLALARQYLAVTRQEELLRRNYRQQVLDIWDACRDPACTADLEREADRLAAGAAPGLVDAIARGLASRLTEGQLRTAIQDAGTPEIQAMSQALIDLSGEFVRASHEASVHQSHEMLAGFCRTHAQACRDAIAAYEAEVRR